MNPKPYWEILGIPRPDLAAVIAKKPKALPFHLMCVALVENGSPMSIPQFADRLGQAGFPFSGRDPETTLKRAWHGREPLHKLPDGRLALDVHSMELGLILYQTGTKPPRERVTSPKLEEMNTEWAREQRKGTPVAIMHALPHGCPPRVVSILDPDKHSIVTFTDHALDEVGSHLESFERIAGLQNWDTLFYLGLDLNRWLLLDLGPYQKSFQLAEGGPSVKLTSEMIISGTTGIRRPLHTSKTIERLARRKDRRELIVCAEKEAQVLLAMYRFGCLHGEVRARMGKYDYFFPVNWSMSSQPRLDELLTHAHDHGKQIRFVVGGPPDLDMPGVTELCGVVLGFDDREILFGHGGRMGTINRYAIHAARIVED
ncbi:MAG: hypothetical protein GF341_12970 [candidate division Zixibacteria bacterium]|nr:hypothetical protein [candidate division Zixibacteria bacterium]